MLKPACDNKWVQASCSVKGEHAAIKLHVKHEKDKVMQMEFVMEGMPRVWRKVTTLNMRKFTSCLDGSRTGKQEVAGLEHWLAFFGPLSRGGAS